MTEATTANPPSTAEVDARARRTRPPRGPASALWSIEVLVVDDDAADSSLIIDVLRRHPRVSAAKAMAEPDEALIQLARGWHNPNLILLDIHMPKVNGFRFVEALRQIPRLSATPVVLLTTSRHVRDVDLARKSDVCSYVVKPDSYEELQTRINSVIKQTLTGVWSHL